MESDKRKVWARVRSARALWFVLVLASRPAHERSVPVARSEVSLLIFHLSLSQADCPSWVLESV